MILGQMFSLPGDGIALVLIPIIVICIVVGAMEIRKKQDFWSQFMTGMEYSVWMNDNYPYDPTYPLPQFGQWETAIAWADQDRVEFKVRFNKYDGHFYDEDDTGYYDYELMIKKSHEG